MSFQSQVDALAAVAAENARPDPGGGRVTPYFVWTFGMDLGRPGSERL
jgi:hypothetical protein